MPWFVITVILLLSFAAEVRAQESLEAVDETSSEEASESSEPDEPDEEV